MSQGPLPPAVPQVLETVRRSRLLDRDGLHAAVRTAPEPVRDDAASLAEHFVRAGLLSRYQANKLLDGITRGLVLGPFQVLAPLGRGGMGAVYLARDTWHRRLLALKVLPPKVARRERRLLARVPPAMGVWPAGGPPRRAGGDAG